MKTYFIFLTIVWCSAVTAAESVTTKSGPVAGTNSRDAAIEVFRGIPYAAAPIGDLRWKPPQPVDEWSDIRTCDQFAAKSLQKNK
mgnify:CR=1 FL=1